MMRISALLIALGMVVGNYAHAGDILVLPGSSELRGPAASQRLIVLIENGGQFVGDVTNKSEFTSSHPDVAKVDAGGRVQPVANGETIITASYAGKQNKAHFRVTNVENP